jgi:hypothetical protein
MRGGWGPEEKSKYSLLQTESFKILCIDLEIDETQIYLYSYARFLSSNAR